MDDINEFITSVQARTHKLLAQNKKLQRSNVRTAISHKYEPSKKPLGQHFLPKTSAEAPKAPSEADVTQGLPLIPLKSPKDKISSSPSKERLKSLPIVQLHTANMNGSKAQSSAESLLQKADHVDLLLKKLGLRPARVKKVEHIVEYRMCASCWADPLKTGCGLNRATKGPGMEPDAVARSLGMQGPSSWSTHDLYTMYRMEKASGLEGHGHLILRMFLCQVDRENRWMMEKFDAHESIRSLDAGVERLSSLKEEHLERLRSRVFSIPKVEQFKNQRSPLSAGKLPTQEHYHSTSRVTSTIPWENAKKRIQIVLHFAWNSSFSRSSPSCLVSLNLCGPVPCRQQIAWTPGLESMPTSASNDQFFAQHFQLSYQHQYDFLTLKYDSPPIISEKRIYPKPIPHPSYNRSEPPVFTLSKSFANDIRLQKGQSCRKSTALQRGICSTTIINAKIVKSRLSSGMNEPFLSRVIMQFHTIRCFRGSEPEPDTNQTRSTKRGSKSHSIQAEELPSTRKTASMTQFITRNHTVLSWNALGNQKNNAKLAGIARSQDTRPDRTPSLIPKPSTRFISNLMRELSAQAQTSPQRLKPNDPQTRQEKHAKAMAHARNSNYEGVELMIRSGIDVDERDELGNTLLILVAQQGSKRLARLLLRNRATLNAQNSHGNTALHYSYHYNHSALSEYLIRNGASNSIQNVRGRNCYEGI
uniref:Uncharacterized protein AlNc14C206G8808 n=1 Tax=Albugo laibachii Nc14 TaxID=890382 RepID=F0WR00_9STRA|nr:conserved hypothetical protein [Albugo laibachii Nc14]|eukprot:CCA23760.1 conserved hypothetical protein [Albugo laibachii Nc14]